MSSLVTVTLPNEGEQEAEEPREVEYGFSFDEWIIENELESIKQILIKHKATTLSTLKFGSMEFQTVVTDTVLLATKAHMLPKLINAVHNITKIVVADEEQQVIDCIKQNLKALNETQQEIETLRVDHPNSTARINASKLEQLAQTERKVNEIFDSLCDILNDRRQAILHD
eukprot:786220_1